MDERIQGARSFESDVTLERSIVGLMKSRDVRFHQAAAGLVAAQGNLTITNGGCGPVVANGGVTITNGGCGPMIANGDVSIQNGGTQAVIAAGGVRIGPKALAGFVLSPQVTVEEGSRVLFGTRQALAFGAAAGVVCALLSRLRRR
jgi:hypothetical protein